MSSLEFRASSVEYASVGPYHDLCVTAPSGCSTGFAIGMWIKMLDECATSAGGQRGILTTWFNAPGGYAEGISIRCGADSFNSMRIELFVYPNVQFSGTITSTTTAGSWFHSTVVWEVSPSSLKLYEDGVILGSISSTTGSSVANPDGMIVFGRKFIKDTTFGSGSALVDDVRILNTPLSATEVQNLYNSYF